MSKRKIIILDALALIFRAYYALPPLKTRDGMTVNAVYGFFNTLFNVIRDYNPDYLCVAFDEKAPTFRKEMYEEYKAQREAPPEDLGPQIPLIREILDQLNIKHYSIPGYEADDIIGTICALKSVDNKDTMSYILTGDLDTLQLIDDNTRVITFKRGMSETIEYDEDMVRKKYEGLTPKQMIDMKAIKGDASDNIPGIKGIGEKGAINLLTEFETLENIYKNIESDKIKDRQRQLLKDEKQTALLSKELVTIITDAPVEFNLEDCRLVPYDRQAVIETLQDLEFKTLLNRLPDFGGEKKKAHKAPKEELEEKTEHNYILIDNQGAFDEFIDELKKQKLFTFDTETTDLDPINAELLGLSFSWKKDKAYYVTVLNKKGDGLFEEAISNTEWLKKLKPIFEDPDIKKVGHNLKYDYQILKQAGIEVANLYFDTMIAAYVIDPDERNFNLDHLVFRETGHEMVSFEDLTGKGKDKISITQVDLDKLSYYAAEDADYTHRLYEILKKELKDKGQLSLFENIEMPLVSVLADMELTGVLIDEDVLKELSKEAGKEIKKIETKIHKLAGREFNINSPNQLQEILFEDLGLSTQGIAKTKTGFSTAASELEKLKDEHEIIRHIIDYRELTKLQSTYLEALPQMINEKTGRVHTSYNQTVAATGRLSSTNPNLQNIPIRSDFGRKIRNAFIAPRGKRILAADYSQIELRLAAHFSGDKNMIKIFKEGRDIHTSTAAVIHDIPQEKVTKQIRSTAKEVNFGIIYGLGPVGLASRTDLNRKEAKEFIETYFERFPGIKEYIEKQKEEAADKGYAQTLFGRRRYLPDLNSNNQMMRAAAERVAVNVPFQGTAADLIKIAMIKIHQELPKVSKESRMIMQVHDELVFEVPQKDVDRVTKFVKETMEKAHSFKVPIIVDVEVGKSWGSLK